MRLALLMVLVLATLPGCGFLVGTAVGALGSSAVYEYSAGQELERLEQDRQRGRISQREYESRKEQINRGSVVY